MASLLLVEDDPVLGHGLSINLGTEGYDVRWSKSLRAAAIAIEERRPDLVILDLGLPDGSGLSFLRRVRETDAALPVIILTAKTDEDSVVEGFQLGANDYVRKPFGDRELIARIKTALREPQLRERQVRFHDLVLLFDQRKATCAGQEIALTPKEFDLLGFLVQHAERVVSREALLGAVDEEGELYDRTIDSHVSHIRSRLRQAGVDSVRISSVYGVGYRLEGVGK